RGARADGAQAARWSPLPRRSTQAAEQETGFGPNEPRQTPFLSSCLLQFASEELVCQLRVGLAATSLHDLADEKTERLTLAGPELSGGIRIPRNDVSNNREQRAFVAVLRQPLGRNDLVGRTAGVVHLRKDVLGDRAADGALFHERNQRREGSGRQRQLTDRDAAFLHRA